MKQITIEKPITAVTKLSVLVSTAVATYGLDLKRYGSLKLALTKPENEVGFTANQADEFMQR